MAELDSAAAHTRTHTRICVEGLIGAGKSTALDAVMACLPEARVFPEPISQWADLLDLFYENPAENGLAFNLRVLLSFVEPGAHPGNCVVERSPQACRHVFGQMLYNDGLLSPQAWDVFKEYADVLAWVPSAYVYVQTPVDVCMERIRRRGRPCEASIDAEYLRRLEFQYDNMLRFTGVPVIRIDGSASEAEVAEAVVQAVKGILGAPEM